jgi:transposase
MARAGPRKIREYSLEFKLTAVRLSEQPGIQVQAVAAALDIHPFMLSKWRKQVRDGVLRGKGRDLTVPPRREIQRLQELERAHALLQEEHELLRKAIRFCSVERQTSSRSSRRKRTRTR